MKGWVAVLLLVARGAAATTFVVAESGGDFTAIQPALDAAMPGDTVHVRAKATPYFEKLVFPRSGATGAWITLDAWPGDQPVIFLSLRSPTLPLSRPAPPPRQSSIACQRPSRSRSHIFGATLASDRSSRCSHRCGAPTRSRPNAIA